MPPLKPTTDEMKSRELCGLIDYHRHKKDLTYKELAIKIHMPYSTLMNKLSRPNNFTFGELKRLAAALGFAPEERGAFI